MRDVEIGWLAGLLEGEGHFCVHREKHGRIEVVTTDEEIARRLQSVTGAGRVNGPYAAHGFGTKPQWRWRVNRRDDVSRIFAYTFALMGARRREQMRRVMDALDR